MVGYSFDVNKADENIVIGGTTSNITLHTDGTDAFVMRVSQSGHLEWYSQISTKTGGTLEYVTSVAINSPSGGSTGSVYAFFFN